MVRSVALARLQNLTRVGKLLPLAAVLVMGGCTGSGASIGAPAASPKPVVAGFIPVHMSFVDSMHGWVIGETCVAGKQGPNSCKPAMAATSNGGGSWHATASPPLIASEESCSPPGCPSHAANTLFVTELDGLAWGSNLLYQTHDGGKTWSPDVVAGDVAAVATLRGEPLMVTRECSGSSELTCTSGVRNSEDEGRTFRPVPLQPGGVPSLSAYVQLVAAGGWIWVLSASTTSADTRVDMSTDGGASWRQLPNPCSPEVQYGERIAVADPMHIWAACGLPGRIGPGAVYTSNDGGDHWLLAASAIQVPVGFGSFVLTSSTNGWLALGGPVGEGGLYASDDAGRTWFDALGVSPISEVAFVDSQHGWALAKPSARGALALYRTVDGGLHWHGSAF